MRLIEKEHCPSRCFLTECVGLYAHTSCLFLAVESHIKGITRGTRLLSQQQTLRDTSNRPNGSEEVIWFQKKKNQEIGMFEFKTAV